jgi:hypothetical protein
VDEDLESMSRDELEAEIINLRNGIGAHRDSALHELCWHHPALWGLLPEKTDPLPAVPDWPQFLRGCGGTGSPSTGSCPRPREVPKSTTGDAVIPELGAAHEC